MSVDEHIKVKPDAVTRPHGENQDWVVWVAKFNRELMLKTWVLVFHGYGDDKERNSNLFVVDQIMHINFICVLLG